MLDVAFGKGSDRARWVCASAACLAVVLVEAPSRAQASPASNGDAHAVEGRRSALYREAAEAAKLGHWSVARDRLREVLAVRESPKVFFSLAQAEEQLGAVASAYTHYARALEGAQAAGEGEVANVAGAAAKAISPRVPHARVVVTGVADVGAVKATLDGEAMAVGASVAVDPGEHRLAVSAPGMAAFSTNVSLREGQDLEVPIRFDAAGIASPPPVPSEAAQAPASQAAPLPSSVTAAARPSSPWPTVGLVAAGAGAIAVGVGAFFGVESAAKHGDAQKRRVRGPRAPMRTAAYPSGTTP